MSNFSSIQERCEKFVYSETSRPAVMHTQGGDFPTQLKQPGREAGHKPTFNIGFKDKWISYLSILCVLNKKAKVHTGR